MEFLTLETVGWAALGLTGTYFLGVPLLILVNQRMPARPEIVEYDESTPLPSIVGDYFYECEHDLEACGFQRIASLAIPDPVPNVRAILQVHMNESTSTTCMITAMFGVSEAGPPQHMEYVEFVTTFRGGDLKMVHTNNSTEISAFPDLLEAMVFRFQHIADVARLHDYHEQLVERHAPGSSKSLAVLDEFGGDVVEYFRAKVFQEGYERQVETGYLRYDSGQECYRPTLGGAYKMTWKNLWPIKPLILSRIRAAGKRLERELAGA